MKRLLNKLYFAPKYKLLIIATILFLLRFNIWDIGIWIIIFSLYSIVLEDLAYCALFSILIFICAIFWLVFDTSSFDVLIMSFFISLLSLNLIMIKHEVYIKYWSIIKEYKSIFLEKLNNKIDMEIDFRNYLLYLLFYFH